MKYLLIVKNSLRPIMPLLYMSFAMLIVFFVGRVILCLMISDRIASIKDLMNIFLFGFRIDLSSLGWILSILFTCTILSSLTIFSWKLYRYLYIVLMSFFVTFSFFMEASTPDFITEYGVRPNRFFVEYLVYPKEVLKMLCQGRALQLVIGLIIVVLVFLGALRIFGKIVKKEYKINKLVTILLLPVILAVTVFMARSTLGHRPINPAMVAFSTDPTINEAVLNSSYSVAFAATRMKKDKSAMEYYGKMDDETLISLVRNNSNRVSQQYEQGGKSQPTLSLNQAAYNRSKPLNIVILLQESFGAQFVKSLGGLDLSPNYEKLSAEGWSFTNAFATGTRSIRGIEAVVSGFPPTPITAVVKLDKAQSNFFTLPALLKSKGYVTSFIYGGETHFDNMKTFFLGNGVQNIIGENDYLNPSFVGSWGVSDEDLYKKVNEQFKTMYASKKPFFSLVFTSSNHDPFEFPDGKIDLYDVNKNTRNNAVKYADYALGEFFKNAKKEEYYKDTIFLIIADHDSRVTGKTSVPLSNYHIPALILGADIKPKIDNRMVSQIDMAPTLLSLAGISASYPMIGQDLCINTNGGRALMQYNNNFAYMIPGKVVLFSPEKEPQTYALEKLSGPLVPISNEKDFVNIGHAMGIIGDYLYSNELYGSEYLNTNSK
jgi:phosphoglycerol transferase MdoB-like AlkP superfamily enzyme